MIYTKGVFLFVLASILISWQVLLEAEAQDGSISSMSAAQMKAEAVDFIESLSSEVAEVGMFKLSDEGQTNDLE